MKSVSDEMMDLVDRLGSQWKGVDARAWRHLLIYAPSHELIAAANRIAQQNEEAARVGEQQNCAEND